MDLYAEHILAHYRNPQFKERLADPSVSHEEVNVSCGDKITVDLQIEDGVIVSVGWDGVGCAISQAGMSMLAEEVVGKSVKEIEDLDEQHMRDLLGVPISLRRLPCALIALHALQRASDMGSDPK